MTPLETKLTNALVANARLREEGERLIAAYIEPGSDQSTIINDSSAYSTARSNAKRSVWRVKRWARTSATTLDVCGRADSDAS
jgi:hypothetical protein